MENYARVFVCVWWLTSFAYMKEFATKSRKYPEKSVGKKAGSQRWSAMLTGKHESNVCTGVSFFCYHVTRAPHKWKIMSKQWKSLAENDIEYTCTHTRRHTSSPLYHPCQGTRQPPSRFNDRNFHFENEMKLIEQRRFVVIQHSIHTHKLISHQWWFAFDEVLRAYYMSAQDIFC